MTREEAIIILGNIPIDGKDKCYSIAEYQEAKTMAIKALEQEPCEDAISRQAVLDGIDTYISKAQSTGTQDDFYSFAELVVKVLPSVKPQEPTTHGYMLVCPNCGLDVHSDFESCPRCGENLKARKHEERLQRERR